LNQSIVENANNSETSAMKNSYWTDFLHAQIYKLKGRYSTRILEAGDGEPLLLLHGTGGHIENYARNIMPLSQHFHVIAMDFLWHGGSETGGFEPAIIPKLIDQIVDVLDTLGIASTHLEGQSLGGWVAMQMALLHPERVNKLVLTTTQGYQPDDGSIPGLVEPDPRRIQAHSLQVLRDPSFENVRSRLERVMAHPELLPDEAVAVRHKFYNDPVLNRVQQQFMEHYPIGDALLKHLVTDARAADIKAPTLIFWGDKNPVPPVVGQRLSQSIPNARFFNAPETGHMAQFESYELHNREVSSFLRDSPFP
jgi:2-hydroxy-6-oxonona-2,4-dienedioate hydrolase